MNPRLLLKWIPYVVCLVVFLSLLGARYDSKTGFTSVIRFGDLYAETRHPAIRAVPHAQETNSWGYDSQWYATLAVDPNLRNPELQNSLDAPSYRARRILFDLAPLSRTLS